MPNPEPIALRRCISLPLLTFYGLGNILGAGIYVLVGKVAGVAGLFAPLAFLLAALVAGFTALAYAELAARFPVSAGEAVYVQRGFGWTPLARLVGLLVLLVGIISSATLARGFVAYLQVFVTPTCPYCPQAVRLAHKLAMESELITADMVEAIEFPHLSNKYHVHGVPRTVINETFHQEGAVPEPLLLAKLQEAVA